MYFSCLNSLFIHFLFEYFDEVLFELSGLFSCVTHYQERESVFCNFIGFLFSVTGIGVCDLPKIVEIKNL